MPTVYLIHGFVGAGKTTFSKKLENDTDAVRYSPDEWMSARHGINPPVEYFGQYLADIKKDIVEDAHKNAESGRDIIFDYGFWKRAERDAYRALAKNWNADCQLVWIKSDDRLMEERVLARSLELPKGQLVIDKNAIAEFRQRFEPLHEDEDHIVIEN